MAKFVATINKKTGLISIKSEEGECLTKELEKALGLDQPQPETYEQTTQTKQQQTTGNQ